MNWMWLAAKSPKWAVAVLIVAISSVLFIGWLMFRSNNQSRHASGVGEVGSASTVGEFKTDEVILCGNTLIELKSGKVLTKAWLEGFGSSPPTISRVLADEKLVIVSGALGQFGAFGFDGKAKPPLRFEGKALPSAAFDHHFEQIVFPRDGDLWLGNPDWQKGLVQESRKLTSVGYFRNNVLSQPWLWHEGDLLVSVLGKTLDVKLEGGEISVVPVSFDQLQRGMSSDGSFSVVTPSPREIGVVDLKTGASKKYSVGQKVRKLLWLSPRKVAIGVGNNQVAEYDHDKKALEGPQQSEGQIRDIAEPCPDGSGFLVVCNDSVLILDLAVKKHTEIKNRYDAMKWVSNDMLLCSSGAMDTEHRGLWLVTKTGEEKKISGQPLDAGGRNFGEAPLEIANGSAYFISGGNLWSFEISSLGLKQLTQGEQLPPRLQLLNR